MTGKRDDLHGTLMVRKNYDEMQIERMNLHISVDANTQTTRRYIPCRAGWI